MRLLKRVIVLLLFAAVLFTGILFTIQNTATAPLDLLVIQLSEQRVALWVLAAFALGGFVGMAISFLGLLRLKSDMLLLTRKLKKRDAELSKFRNSDLFPAKLTEGDNEPLKHKA